MKKYLLKLSTCTEYKRDKFSKNVEYICEFSLLKKLQNLKVSNIQGHGNHKFSHGLYAYVKIAIYVVKTTFSIMQTTVG